MVATIGGLVIIRFDDGVEIRVGKNATLTVYPLDEDS
jgi:hypothetical protein